MKREILSIFFIYLCINGQSQTDLSLTSPVFSVVGNNNYEFEFQVGEVFTQSTQGKGFWFTQGFSQPYFSDSLNGLSNNNNLVVEVYPNPFSDQICFTNLPDDYSYTIFSSAGKIIYTGRNEHKISLPHLSAGIYYLRLNIIQLNLYKNFILCCVP